MKSVVRVGVSVSATNAIVVDLQHPLFGPCPTMADERFLTAFCCRKIAVGEGGKIDKSGFSAERQPSRAGKGLVLSAELRSPGNLSALQLLHPGLPSNSPGRQIQCNSAWKKNQVRNDWMGF